jgi:hypothetical protein
MLKTMHAGTADICPRVTVVARGSPLNRARKGHGRATHYERVSLRRMRRVNSPRSG